MRSELSALSLHHIKTAVFTVVLVLPCISAHADEIRDFLKTDTTVFKYKFGNKWIVNYDQLLPHLKKINRRESKLWKAYMARIGIKKSVTPRKK